ncbi:hypothetical protein GV828_04835 [Flavobacterium sp. NST-5]|uniref:Uncharacterized protein n=1 Tax=Flavobacterium ichthyis TaxID=2698827 RepID=A0ABW9Z6Q5_9FLAO|nr:hypothetical protein [Flavobacterium ichthyis]NBL64525.1 hypothetical protein [Flavobacterium ichthyis]
MSSFTTTYFGSLNSTIEFSSIGFSVGFTNGTTNVSTGVSIANQLNTSVGYTNKDGQTTNANFSFYPNRIVVNLVAVVVGTIIIATQPELAPIIFAF